MGIRLDANPIVCEVLIEISIFVLDLSSRENWFSVADLRGVFEMEG